MPKVTLFQKSWLETILFFHVLLAEQFRLCQNSHTFGQELKTVKHLELCSKEKKNTFQLLMCFFFQFRYLKAAIPLMAALLALGLLSMSIMRQ